jgi:hypothetical protein
MRPSGFADAIIQRLEDFYKPENTVERSSTTMQIQVVPVNSSSSTPPRQFAPVSADWQNIPLFFRDSADGEFSLARLWKASLQ